MNVPVCWQLHSVIHEAIKTLVNVYTTMIKSTVVMRLSHFKVTKASVAIE